MPKVLIVQGGWDGHDPQGVSNLFKRILEAENFSVEISNTLDSFLNAEKLKTLHLIIPVWTMGKISGEQCGHVLKAVGDYGVGIAGCHGGMCDAFRENTEWQFLTGGQWVSHPGGDGVTHCVHLKRGSSPITQDLEDFEIATEQYYLHIDPAVEVLATTRFPVAHGYHVSNGAVDVPYMWTKRWGHGRVFYSALGHTAKVFENKTSLELMRRGFLWAAAGRDLAIKNKLDPNFYHEKK